MVLRLVLDSKKMTNFQLYSGLFLLSVYYVLSEKCTDVGTFGIQYKSDGDDIKDRLRGAKIDFGKLPKYNKSFVFLYYGRAPLLCKELLAPLSEVRVLKIYNFEINEIEKGTFDDLKYLDTIGIYQNNIRNIENGIFNNLNVSRLVLDKNGIVHIERTAFDNMTNLRLISIEQNKLIIINPNWFNNCPNLHILYLDNNKITSLPERAFRNLRNGSDCNLKIEDNHCPQIWLQSNRINDIHPDTLKGLTKIQNIMLGNNEISNVTNIFQNLEISVISLEYNELTCINNGIMDSLMAAETVYIGGNNLRKECLQNINDSISSNKSTIIFKLRLTDEDEE